MNEVLLTINGMDTEMEASRKIQKKMICYTNPK